MRWIVIAIACVLVIAAVLAFFVSRNRPENASSHDEPDRAGSSLMYGDVNDRPGGPGAEDDGVAGRGQPAPGPSAESSPWPEDAQARQMGNADARRRSSGDDRRR